MPPPSTRGRTIVWKPLVVCPQPEVCRRMLTSLAVLAIDHSCALTQYPPAGTIAGLAERNGCNICFLDAATDSEAAQLLISELAPHPGNRCCTRCAPPAPRSFPREDTA